MALSMASCDLPWAMALALRLSGEQSRGYLIQLKLKIA